MNNIKASEALINNTKFSYININDSSVLAAAKGNNIFYHKALPFGNNEHVVHCLKTHGFMVKTNRLYITDIFTFNKVYKQNTSS